MLVVAAASCNLTAALFEWGYIVPEASHPGVAADARSGRVLILLANLLRAVLREETYNQAAKTGERKCPYIPDPFLRFLKKQHELPMQLFQKAAFISV
jgi:hypothetical protein